MKTPFYTAQCEKNPPLGFYYLVNVSETNARDNTWHLLNPDATSRFLVQVSNRYAFTYSKGMLVRVLQNFNIRSATLTDRVVFNLTRK
jgi:hypothetical protein